LKEIGKNEDERKLCSKLPENEKGGHGRWKSEVRVLKFVFLPPTLVPRPVGEVATACGQVVAGPTHDPWPRDHAPSNHGPWMMFQSRFLEFCLLFIKVVNVARR
jgi:hypothetical protein